MNRRTLPVAALALLLAALVALGGTDRSPPAPVDVPSLPRADAVDALTSSWFCPSAQGGPGNVQATAIDVANTSPSSRSGTVTWFAVGDGTATAQPFTVAPGALLRLRSVPGGPTPAASALVETAGGGVVVEQIVTGPAGRGLAPCASDTSADWYLANGTTLVDAIEVLSLFNPLPSDAVVDIEFATDEGREAPGGAQGLVIPARRTTLLDVGASVRRQAITAAAIRARTGQLAVTRLQVFDGTAGRTGMSLALTARAPAVRWMFADGVSTPSWMSTWQVFNPGPTEAHVSIEVVPATGDPPEAIDVTVPPRSQVAVPAARPGGVVEGVAFASTVTSGNGVPIVVELSFDARLAGQSGWSSSLGTTEAGADLAFASGDGSAGGSESLALFNPGSSPRTVALSSLTPSGPTPVPGSEVVVVPPAAKVAVPLAPVQTGPHGLRLRADGPIVAERWVRAVGQPGLSVVAGVPLRAQELRANTAATPAAASRPPGSSRQPSAGEAAASP